MNKISIIGAGAVGATTAFSLLQKGLSSKLVINDINNDKAMGEVLDLMHGSSLLKPVEVTVGSIEDTKNSDIVIITAGAAQKPGETRLDLVDKNYKIFSGFVPKLAKLSPNAIFLVVANPVDVLTQITYKLSGLPAHRVIGSGTVLDTARLKSLLGKYVGVDGRNIHSYVIGEHGDSELVTWSSTRVSNIPIKECCEQLSLDWDKDIEDIIENDVKNSAYEVIAKKGATYYAIAVAVTRICEAIAGNEKSILTVSSHLEGQYGLDDVYIGVPSIVSEHGIEKILEIELKKEEKEKLEESVKILKEVYNDVSKNNK
ncbi:L-lactate dehydrogenase [Clostridium fallax]|uniref:L-lactate dehydrogenase n=1 Tax=Clostridium fallax TaxID=1533 RepID=A0A1M4WWP1_9CLOT|nr:L-lactate dehydrogenase [Clostridium fallax]SHE85557.1 L-lactate dehydrogenase [Clostridium fallax]SQB07444.1 L-lactate dehydrogenase [Clostridium fallax]